MVGSLNSSKKSPAYVGFLYCQSADIDEKAIRMERPEELVKVLAEAKVCSYVQTSAAFCC
jgi:predicted house-cleaning NTP pyrophosphatase (Maf/HAM1 superfamily)